MIMPSSDSFIADLAKWIADRWERGFCHSYSIAGSNSPVWRSWRLEIQPNSPDLWWCDSIGQAARHYSWLPANPSFEDLSNEVISAISMGDEMACLLSCKKIFKWGGVARKSNDRSNQWVDNKASVGQLCSSIKRAVYLLSPGCLESLDEFDGTRLLMNSALTKVYAAADSENGTVIYDGRVGAALGLFVRKMLEEKCMHTVPDSLMFEWGPPSSLIAAKLRTRDPSVGSLKFKQLSVTSQDPNADFSRAALSRATNGLLRNAVDLINSSGIEVRSIDLERALFMIGYDVRVGGGSASLFKEIRVTLHK